MPHIPRLNRDLYLALSTLEPFIYVETEEPSRLLTWLAETKTIGNQTPNFRVWKASLGELPLEEYVELWRNIGPVTMKETANPHTFLEGVRAERVKGTGVFHIVLGADQTLLSGRDPMLTRRLMDIAEQVHSSGENPHSYKSMVFVGPSLQIPPGMERMFKVCSFDLPTASEHKEILKGLSAEASDEDATGFSENFNNALPDLSIQSYEEEAQPEFIVEAELDILSDALIGMTSYEAISAIMRSVALYDEVKVEHLLEAKREALKKNPLLELVAPTLSFDDVGGMGALKDYLKTRQNSWTAEGKAYNLPRFKGVLQVGLPGNGKSLLCKAIAKEYGLPLVKFDPGKLFSGQVGASESNMRKALNALEALSPCIAWIDEIEKGLAGMQSSSFSDSGTTARVIGTFLNWMQECDKDVILMATANDITALPPELIRRFDEVFFVGLPEERQRRQIWEIQIRSHKRNPEDFNLGALVDASPNRSGAEIEIAVGAALFTSFADDKRALRTSDMIEAIKAKPPLLVTMREPLEKLLQWVGKDESTGEGVRARFAHQIDVEEAMEVI